MDHSTRRGVFIPCVQHVQAVPDDVQLKACIIIVDPVIRKHHEEHVVWLPRPGCHGLCARTLNVCSTCLTNLVLKWSV